MRRRPRTHAFRQALTLDFCERNFPVSRPPHLLSPILCAANSMNRPVTQYKLFMGHDTSPTDVAIAVGFGIEASMLRRRNRSTPDQPWLRMPVPCTAPSSALICASVFADHGGVRAFRPAVQKIYIANWQHNLVDVDCNPVDQCATARLRFVKLMAILTGFRRYMRPARPEREQWRGG